MAVATNTLVSITKTLPKGVVTTYTDVSLYIELNSIITRYNVVVTNSTLTTDGSLVASNVTFPSSGVYTGVYRAESAADLDTHGVTLTPIATTKITAYESDTNIVV